MNAAFYESTLGQTLEKKYSGGYATQIQPGTFGQVMKATQGEIQRGKIDLQGDDSSMFDQQHLFKGTSSVMTRNLEAGQTAVGSNDMSIEAEEEEKDLFEREFFSTYMQNEYMANRVNMPMSMKERTE